MTIRYRPGKEMLLADALSRCPSRASGEIKLDMRVDYIAFSKTWIAKLKDTTREDPILGTVYQLTQQGSPHQRRHTPQNGQGVLGLQRPALHRRGTAPDGPQNCHSVLPSVRSIFKDSTRAISQPPRYSRMLVNTYIGQGWMQT